MLQQDRKPIPLWNALNHFMGFELSKCSSCKKYKLIGNNNMDGNNNIFYESLLQHLFFTPDIFCGVDNKFSLVCCMMYF